MSEPSTPSTNPQPISPTGEAVIKLPALFGSIVAVLVAVAGALPMVPGLPPVVSAVCGVIVALGAGLGVVSAGARK